MSRGNPRPVNPGADHWLRHQSYARVRQRKIDQGEPAGEEEGKLTKRPDGAEKIREPMEKRWARDEKQTIKKIDEDIYGYDFDS